MANSHHNTVSAIVFAICIAIILIAGVMASDYFTRYRDDPWGQLIRDLTTDVDPETYREEFESLPKHVQKDIGRLLP